MKGTQKITLAATAAFFLLSSSAFAHNLWIISSNEDGLKADMIYGHHFPDPEEIAEDRVALFEPVKVFGKEYKETLTSKGEAYHYEGKEALKEGTYIVEAYYKPTAWSEKADGEWEMAKTRKDIDGEVKSCGIYSMHGKHILTVGADDGAYAMEPLGTYLEITPMVKASEIALDKPVTFKITRDGEPVKQAEIFGNYKGFSKDGMSAPFYAKSDLKGEFTFRGLHAGLWYLKAYVKTDTGDADCEMRGEKTSLTFMVK